MEHYYGQELVVEVVDGQLVVRIGIETLAHAASYAEWANRYDQDARDFIRTFAIVDPACFAKDVKLALTREREDGSSLLSDVLDKASEAALDDGSESCEYDQRIATGEFSPLEKWSAK